MAKVENELHVQAFNFYYGLGKSRSLKKVAEHFGKTERTIANWSRDFNWGERVTQRAIEEDESEQKRAATLPHSLSLRCHACPLKMRSLILSRLRQSRTPAQDPSSP